MRDNYIYICDVIGSWCIYPTALVHVTNMEGVYIVYVPLERCAWSRQHTSQQNVQSMSKARRILAGRQHIAMSASYIPTFASV